MNKHEKPAQCNGYWCNGTDIRMALRTIKGGNQQHCWQCLDCGKAQTGAIKKDVALKLDPNPIPWDDSLEEAHRERRRAECEARIALPLPGEEEAKAAIEAAEAERAEGRRWYNEVYLRSSEWRAIRAKRIAFDRGVCQGCLDAPATQVHHKTYDNIGDELLYQLVSLCRPCHEKAHLIKND